MKPDGETENSLKDILSGRIFPIEGVSKNKQIFENGAFKGLNDYISSNSSVNNDDVLNVKKALVEAGHYEPNSRAGESFSNLSGYPDETFFNAIKSFQKDKGLLVDGVMKKGGETEISLMNSFMEPSEKEKARLKKAGIYDKVRFMQEDPSNKENTKNSTQANNELKATWNKPIDIKKGQEVVFDGKTFTLYEDGTKVKSWEAVSGEKGFQSKEYQGLRNKGPIPEGTYVARKETFQEMSKSDYLKGFVGRGAWRGQITSWGTQRVWLEPSKETNTKDRSGFSIHGGRDRGSRGCIDLTNQMPEFGAWFKKNNKDVKVIVKY
ncbi:MAG: tlde1 domain-containing protein [Alphaproteobacteria bacterium]